MLNILYLPTIGYMINPGNLKFLNTKKPFKLCKGSLVTTVPENSEIYKKLQLIFAKPVIKFTVNTV